MDEIKKQKNILHQLIKSREAVRRKYNLLKHSHEQEENKIKAALKPITNPLEQIVTLVGQKPHKSIKSKVYETPPYSDVEASIADDDAASSAAAYESADDENRTIIDLRDSLKSYLFSLESNNAKALDTITGVRKQDGKLLMGNSHITFDDENLIINGLKFPKSDGLMELIFEKSPENYDGNDLRNYREILDLTKAHRRQYRADEPVRAIRSRKYQNIIHPLYERSGGGIRRNMKYKVASLNKTIDYEFWDDPNELVDRLKLLIAEQSAGNNSHTNSIHSIIQELRQAGYIY